MLFLYSIIIKWISLMFIYIYIYIYTGKDYCSNLYDSLIQHFDKTQWVGISINTHLIHLHQLIKFQHSKFMLQLAWMQHATDLATNVLWRLTQSRAWFIKICLAEAFWSISANTNETRFSLYMILYSIAAMIKAYLTTQKYLYVKINYFQILNNPFF